MRERKIKKLIIMIIKWSLLLAFIFMPAYSLFKYASDLVEFEGTVNKQLDGKIANLSEVTSILSDIKNQNLDLAVYKINTNLDDNIPPETRKYLLSFYAYYEYKKYESGQNILEKTVGKAFDIASNIPKIGKYFENDTVKPEEYNNPEYFLEHLIDITSYLESINLSKTDIYAFSEIIPYYCISKYELYNNKTAKLCDLYFKNITEPNGGVLSKEGAIIACIKIRSLYETRNSNESEWRSLQNHIKKMREVDFKNELGENGRYRAQAEYLKNFYEHLEDLRNGWKLTKLIGGNLLKKYRFDETIPEL